MTRLEDALYQRSLPQVWCHGCHHAIPRGAGRVTVRASWRPAQEYLCPNCWQVTMRAAWAMLSESADILWEQSRLIEVDDDPA